MPVSFNSSPPALPQLALTIADKGADLVHFTGRTIDPAIVQYGAGALNLGGDGANQLNLSANGVTITGFIKQFGNTTNGSNQDTHVNLGLNGSTTGESGQNRTYCTVLGGGNNDALQNYDVNCGGSSNTVDSGNGFNGGGSANTVTGYAAVIVASADNTNQGARSGIFGGDDHTITGSAGYSFIGGGWQNEITLGPYSTVHGANNQINGSAHSVICGGGHLTPGSRNIISATGDYNIIGGGYVNSISGTSANSGVFSGHSHDIQAINAAIVGGFDHSVTANYGAILGGYRNQVTSIRAAVLCGTDNVASGNDSINLGGQNGTINGQGSFGYIYAPVTPTTLTGGNRGVFYNESGFLIGIDTVNPRRSLDILNATNPQLRVTHTDNTNYAEFQADGSGDLTIVSSGGNTTLSDNVTISGNLTVSGTTTTIDTTTLQATDNIIVCNHGESGAGVTAGTAGLEVDRGSSTNYQFIFQESDDSFRIGEVGSTQAVATREDSPNANSIPYWDSGNNRFSTSSALTFQNSILTVSTDAAIQIPTGNTGQRPGSPAFGMMRGNSDSSDFEFYDGGAWVTIADSAAVALNTTHRNGDGSDHADVATNTGNISTNTTNISNLTDAVGSATEAGITYSSTNYVTSGQDTVTAIGDLDSQVKTNEDITAANNSAIVGVQGAIGALTEGNIDYSSNNYVTDAEDCVTAIGDLDAQVKTNADNIATASSHASGDGSDHADVATNTTHRGLTNNPHSVTAAQVSAVAISGDKMTGDLEIEKATAKLTLDSTSGQSLISFQSSGSEDVNIAKSGDGQYLAINSQNTSTGLDMNDKAIVDITNIELKEMTAPGNKAGYGKVYVNQSNNNLEVVFPNNETRTIRNNSAAQSYSATNVTTKRTFDCDATSVAELADVLATLLNDLSQDGSVDYT